MGAKRRLPAFLLAVVLCLGLFPPISVSAADLYFTSLNDTLQPLTSDTMPVWSGGTLYVPYSVFDSNINGTGVKLGMECSYERNSNIVTLYNLQKMLVFDLNAGICRNELTGETYSARAITRNGRPYLPLGMVCDFFGLTYSYNAISQGYLVRIKSADVVLSDTKFIDAAGDLINRRLREYYQSLTPSTDTTSPSDSNPTAPDQEEDDETALSSTRVYLAFSWEDAQSAGDILTALDGRAYALFLLTPQAMEDNPDLVRRILGTGHSVGILSREEDLSRTWQVLEEGAAQLKQIAHTTATIACVPSAQRAAVEQEGWVCWSETLSMAPGQDAGAGSFASSVLRRLQGRSARTYLTLPGDANTARVLSTLLRELEDSDFTLSTPLETRL